MYLYCINHKECGSEQCKWRRTIFAPHRKPSALNFVCYQFRSLDNQRFRMHRKASIRQYDSKSGKKVLRWDDIFNYVEGYYTDMFRNKPDDFYNLLNKHRHSGVQEDITPENIHRYYIVIGNYHFKYNSVDRSINSLR